MGFWDTVGDIGSIAFPVAGGMIGGKGMGGGLNTALWGNTGDVNYNVPPYQPAPLTPVNRADFGFNKDIWETRINGELAKNSQRLPPRARFEPTTVATPGYRPEQYGGETLDTSGFNQQMGGFSQSLQNAAEARRQQASDLGIVRAAAQGAAPSAAEQQLKSGMERQIAAQASAAASARGGAGAQAAARRQAAFQGAKTMAETNQQTAEVRAQEMANARSQLMAGNEALRSGDINAQGMALQGAQTALTPGLQQAQLSQQAAMQGQNLATQAGMQRAGLQTQAGMQNQQLASQIALANQQAALQSTALQNQYNLGLYGQQFDLNKLQLTGGMGYASLAAQQQLQQAQMAQDAYFRMHGLNAGIAGQNAAAEQARTAATLSLGSSVGEMMSSMYGGG